MRTTRELFNLSGRVALVTGGAGHIGSAIAEALAEWGATIAVADRRSPYVHGGGVLRSCHFPHIVGAAVSDTTHVLDLAQAGAARELADAIERMHGRLDILVHCAALLDAPGLDVPLPEQSLDTWRRSLEVNLTAAFALTQACAPMLADSGHGSMVFISSIYGVVGPDLSIYGDTGMGCGAAYAASKAGLVGLTRHLATVMAPGVRVNCLMPGGVARGQDPAFVGRYCRRVPLGRMATEEDMKGPVLFLASDASAYVTGAVLPVEGGWLAW